MNRLLLLLLLPLLMLLSGCSSQDFGRPIGRMGDVVDSGKAYVENDNAEESMRRATQLATILAEWERQKDSVDVDYTLGPDDVLVVGILSLDAPERVTSLTRTISKDGTVTLPLIGAVTCVGMTARDFQKRVIEAYNGRFLKNPQVDVAVSLYRSAPVVVTGAVGKPGVYYLTHNRSSVLEVLSLANGLTDGAGDNLLIVRKRQGAAPPVAPPPPQEDPAPTVAPAPVAAPAPEPWTGSHIVERVNTMAIELDAATEPVPWTGSHIADLVAAMAEAEGEEADLAEPAPPPESPVAELAAADPPVADPQAAASNELAAAAADAQDEIALNADLITVDLRQLLDKGDMRLNLDIVGGDIVTVPPGRKQFVYVLGYVQRPGAFELENRKRVRALQAVAMAGGLSGAARAQHSFLIIDKPGGRKVVPIDLTKIARGSRPPVYMESGNTLVIGSNMGGKLAEFIKPSASVGANLTPGI
jgi:protein involved in polysaccharide export with SLBB domain